MSSIKKSILSYPDRGAWGNSNYRGNTSGHVIKDLLETYQPKRFVEVFSGGGTGKDVATDLGIKTSVHLDLINGWDALRDEIPVASDFIFSHPPYWDIINYATVRGTSDPDDLSNIMSYDDFIAKLDRVNQKIYDSLVIGGRHAFLVGDVRKKGKYYSIIKDMTWFGDLEMHLIKQQFNTVSSHRNYSGTFIPIAHEHLLIFKKTSIWAVAIKYTKDFVRDLRQMVNVTWRDLIKAAIQALNGHASLQELYKTLDGCAKSQNNQNWQAKIRQVVQGSAFKRVESGTYELN